MDSTPWLLSTTLKGAFSVSHTGLIWQHEPEAFDQLTNKKQLVFDKFTKTFSPNKEKEWKLKI